MTSDPMTSDPDQEILVFLAPSTLGWLLAGLALILGTVSIVRSSRRRTAVSPRTYAVTTLDAGIAIALVASLTGMSAVLLRS